MATAAPAPAAAATPSAATPSVVEHDAPTSNGVPGASLPSRSPALSPSVPPPTELSPALSTLLQSVVSHLQQPSYPLPLDPASLVNLTVLTHLPAFQHVPDTLLLPSLVQLLSSSLASHHRAVLSAHLLYHVDRLLCSVLSAHGFPCRPSIPHIVDDDDDDAGGAHSIRGISGGSLRLFPDAHTARVAGLRHILQRASPSADAHPILLLPSIPNGFPYLDRLLFDVGLSADHVRWVSLTPWVAGLNGSDAPERLKEPAEDAEHINPLVAHHIDLQDLQTILVGLASSAPRPSPLVLLTALGSDWSGADVAYYTESLVKVKELCRPHGVWIHVEGDLLWKDDDLQRRLAEDARPPPKADVKKGKAASAHAKKPSKAVITSTLYNCADSVVFSTAAFTTGALSVSALKEREKAPSTPTGGGGKAAAVAVPHTFPVELEEFAQLFRVWFDLSNAPSLASVLSSATSSVVAQLTEFRRSLLTQPFSVYLIAPVGELDGHDASAPSASVSHSHVFFQLSVSPPLDPSFFHLTVNELNVYVAYCLFLRAFSSPHSPLAAMYGSVLAPATYFDLKGFVYKPRPALPSSPSADVSSFFSAVRDEIAVLDAAGKAREELQAILAQELEFAYVPVADLKQSPRIGAGAFRFIPSQVPEGHINELVRSLNRKLRSLPSALQHPFPSSPFLPLSPPVAVSMFRPGMTVKGEECTIIDVSPYLVTRGLASLWADVKSVAGHLSLPKRVMADVSESVQRGIKEAEKKLDEVTANVYAPTNMVRWLPVVGSVVNYWMPTDTDAQAAPGQSYDLRKKELNVIRYSYHNKTAPTSTPPLPSAAQAERPVSALDLHPAAPPAAAAAASKDLPESARLAVTVSATPVLQSAQQPSTPSTPSVASLATSPSHGLVRSVSDASPSSSAGQSALSTPAKKKTISINIDEGEKSILQTPLQPLPDVIAFLTKGVVFTSYFPSADPPSPSAQQPAPSSPPFISAELLIFYALSYTGADAAEADLGSGPILAWCEPGQRYLSVDQAIAIDHIHELFLGRKPSFPSGVKGESGTCMSILTPQVSLYLQAQTKASRDEFFLALYALLQALQHGGKRIKKAANGDGKAKKRPSDSSTPPSTSAGPSPLPSPRLGPSDQHGPADLPAARQLLESGMPFIVFVLDKNNSDVTSKHEVTLWFRPDPDAPPTTTAGAAPTTGHLCWCRRGSHLDYSPSRSLPITSTVQICLGKETKALRNAAAAHSPVDRCFSILCGRPPRMILNLEATTAEARTVWLNAFHQVMTAAGKQRVFEQAGGAKPAKLVEG